MSGTAMTEWQYRVERLSAALLEAGVDWNPRFVNPVIRVRRGTRLAPELVAEMTSVLEMLRAIVGRTTTVADLQEFLRKCEDKARYLERVERDEAARALAARWRDLASRALENAALLLEEADDLRREGPGPPIPRIEVVHQAEGWPPLELAFSPVSMATELDRNYKVQLEEPELRAPAALASLRALVRAWKEGALDVA